ncbi:MAG: hypothetical protein ACI4TI_04065, partial [Christensenellales bacterium]
MSKRKYNFIVTVSIVLLALVVLLNVFATLAYFTSSKEYNGTLEYGGIKINANNEIGASSYFASSLIENAKPGDSLLNQDARFSLDSTSEPAYVRAKYTASVKKSKNLFNAKTFVDNAVSLGYSNISINNNYSNAINVPQVPYAEDKSKLSFACESKTSYTFSCKIDPTGLQDNAYCNFRFYYSDGTYEDCKVNKSSTSCLFTTNASKTLSYISIAGWGYSGSFVAYEIQFEKGSTATDYVSCDIVDADYEVANYLKYRNMVLGENLFDYGTPSDYTTVLGTKPELTMSANSLKFASQGGGSPGILKNTFYEYSTGDTYRITRTSGNRILVRVLDENKNTITTLEDGTAIANGATYGSLQWNVYYKCYFTPSTAKVITFSFTDSRIKYLQIGFSTNQSSGTVENYQNIQLIKTNLFDLSAELVQSSGSPTTVHNVVGNEGVILSGISPNGYSSTISVTDVVISGNTVTFQGSQASGYGVGQVVKVVEGQKYELSSDSKTNATFAFGFYDKDGMYLSNTYSNPATVPENAEYMIAVLNTTYNSAGGVVTVTVNNPKLTLVGGNNYTWSNKIGDYYYLLNSSTGEPLLLDDSTKSFTFLTKENSKIADNFAYSSSLSGNPISLEITFEAIQAANLATSDPTKTLLENIKQKLDAINSVSTTGSFTVKFVVDGTTYTKSGIAYGGDCTLDTAVVNAIKSSTFGGFAFSESGYPVITAGGNCHSYIDLANNKLKNVTENLTIYSAGKVVEQKLY